MLLCIDIGATKTLVAAFTEEGKISGEFKFPTAKNYRKFLKDLSKAIQSQFKDIDFRAGCCAVPGIVERQKGLGLEFGNLPWRHVHIRDDASEAAGGVPIKIENDTNLAGLYEASEFGKKYQKILYVTFSTGIRAAFIEQGKLVESLADAEAGQMITRYKSKLQKWEDFASGRALFAKYGKKASEINSAKVWQEFVPGMAQGLGQLIATFPADVIVIGGGMGAHLEKYGQLLVDELEKYGNKMVNVPPVTKALKPEEAVIYGCYEYIKD